MKIASPSFENGERIPRRHAREGDDASPPLRWSDAPEETQSFALLVTDPDAPDTTFTHWVLYDVPASRRELPEGVAAVGHAGRNDFEFTGWGGPHPPPGHGDHRYYFRLYALDVPALGLEPGARRADVERGMEGHVLAEAEFMGRYARGASPG